MGLFNSRHSFLAAVSVRAFRIACLILCHSSLFAQEASAPDPGLDQLYRLRDQGAWQQLLEAAALMNEGSPDVRFLRGVALAKSGQLTEAEAELKRALHEARTDRPDILVELAGVQFKQKRFDESRTSLRRAASLGYADSYVLDFLASLYYLDDNLPAALKYWNRIGKPSIGELKVEPRNGLDPVLLDRALAFSPASELTLRSLRLTEARLDMLGVFARRRYDLSAHADGRFDLTVLTVPKTDVRSDSKWRSLLLASRELPFSTLSADVRNIRHSAINLSSSFRWKPANRRLTSELSAPFGRNPDLLYRLGATVNDELWNLGGWSQGPDLARMRVAEAQAGITAIAGERWTWSTAVSASYRRLGDDARQPLDADPRLTSGSVLASRWGTRYSLLNVPERRLDVSTTGRLELGRFWHSQATLFTIGQVGIDTVWQAQDDNRLIVTGQVQTGTSAGLLPFDRLFRLGVDRDNDLLLRGHPGSADGLKGNSPMGTGYILANLDSQKRLYSNGLLSFSVGPFLDSGKILESRSDSGKRWMWDPGIEGRLGVLGLFQVALSYGIDVHSGDRVVFFRVINQ